MRTIRLAVAPQERAAAFTVRYDVFVTEQQVPADLELDDLDGPAEHFVAYDGEAADGEAADPAAAIGAGRLVVEPAGFGGADLALGPVGHLGRLAVRAKARGSGLGVELVLAIEARAAERGLALMVLAAQTQATGFYERLGYTAYGEVFDDAGLPHRWMRRPLP